MLWASFNFFREWGYNLGYPQLFPNHKRPSDEGHGSSSSGGGQGHLLAAGARHHWLGDGRPWLTGEAITLADYFVGGLVALGDVIRWDFAKTPKVAAWLGRVKGLGTGAR